MKKLLAKGVSPMSKKQTSVEKIELLIIQAALDAKSGLELGYSWRDVWSDVWIELQDEIERICKQEIYNKTH
jgi:hypothetical protein